MTDRLRRFLFESEPLRGHWLQLEESWAQAVEHQHYAPEVRRVLGEALAAAALLAATLKFHGTLALQIAGGSGPLTMLIAQATHDQGLRALARVGEVDVTGLDFRALVGNAQLTVTLESDERGGSWQGIVPLQGDSLAHCLEAYFATSEQLPTRVALAADERRVGGLLLQKMPSPSAAGEASEGRVRELWDEAGLLMATLAADELLAIEPESLLPRLFPGQELRLFEGQPVRFQCRCGRERVAGVLRSLGEAEVRDVLREQGAVTVTCEFCQRPYRFDAVDVEGLFHAGPTEQGSTTIN